MRQTKETDLSSRTKTADRILDTSRRLFNDKGYAATSISEIAVEVGISPGNLNYHFPTKSDLVVRIAKNAREAVQARRNNRQPGAIGDDYVEHLLFAMGITWTNRFLLRDRIHFADKIGTSEDEFLADFQELRGLIERIEKEGLFREGAVESVETLTRSIWVMSRYWMDYLREFEGLKDISWYDQERGAEHHFALLLPCLTDPGKTAFREALKRAMSAERALERRVDLATTTAQ